MRKLVLIAGLTIVVGCSNDPSGSASSGGDIRLENASVAEVAKQAAAAGKSRIEPGAWERTVNIVSMDIPGLPEPMRSQMAAEASKPAPVQKECKQANAEPVDFTQFPAQAESCVYSRYELTGEKIDATMVCTSPIGDVKMAINGTQSPTSYDMLMTQTQMVPDHGEAKSVFRIAGKRVGSC